MDENILTSPNGAFSPENEATTVGRMSEAARAQMEAWSMSEADASRLETLAGKYDYGSCDVKVEQIIASGALLDSSRNQVVLPNYSEFQGPKLQGHCADIAIKTYCDLNESWIKGINEQRDTQGLPPIDVLYFAGNSGTHFTQPNIKHIWTGILPRGEAIDKALIVDGSFGVVLAAEEGGYVPQEWCQPTSMQPSTAADFPIGELETDRKGRLTALQYSVNTLGMAESGNTAIGAAFIKDSSNNIKPMLEARDANGNIALCLPGKDGPYWYEHGGEISDADRAEIWSLHSRLLSELEYTTATSQQIDELISASPSITVDIGG